mmetsp:Transcript_17002/g.34418  ORF Transcript_17002/g.34418 Transcript_17002/m.34418 type:complete len:229 (+) Transcript_17002:3602-4288(+)
MKRRPTAGQFAVLHNPDSISEGIGFVHKVSRQDDHTALLGPPNDLPHRPPRIRVNSAGRLVQEHKIAVTDECHRDGELTLLTPRESMSLNVDFLRQPNELNHIIHRFFNFGTRDALGSRHDAQVLRDREVREQDVVLRAHPKNLLNGIEIPRDCEVLAIPGMQDRIATSHVVHPGEHVDCGRFPSSVMSEEGEDLIAKHVHAQPINSNKRSMITGELFAQIRDRQTLL